MKKNKLENIIELVLPSMPLIFSIFINSFFYGRLKIITQESFLIINICSYIYWLILFSRLANKYTIIQPLENEESNTRLAELRGMITVNMIYSLTIIGVWISVQSVNSIYAVSFPLIYSVFSGVYFIFTIIFYSGFARYLSRSNYIESINITPIEKIVIPVRAVDFFKRLGKTIVFMVPPLIASCVFTFLLFKISHYENIIMNHISAIGTSFTITSFFYYIFRTRDTK